jgi:hypothetical protein
MLSESREQYLACFVGWQEFPKSDGIRYPSKAIQALDVHSACLASRSDGVFLGWGGVPSPKQNGAVALSRVRNER